MHELVAYGAEKHAYHVCSKLELQSCAVVQLIEH